MITRVCAPAEVSGAAWTLSLLSQGKSLSSPETQRRYPRLIERGEPHAYVLRGAGDHKVRNDHGRTENHITLIQRESSLCEVVPVI